MADVTKIDIDGVQWDIKDQKAQNKVAELETKTTISEKIIAQKGTSCISLVTINDKKFIHFRFKGDIIVSNIGQVLFNVGVIEGLTETISVIADLTRIDGTGRYPTVIDLTVDGMVKAFPMLPNQFSGIIYKCSLYGDCLTIIS